VCHDFTYRLCQSAEASVKAPPGSQNTKSLRLTAAPLLL
jgi:hypothetical protein